MSQRGDLAKRSKRFVICRGIRPITNFISVEIKFFSALVLRSRLLTGPAQNLSNPSRDNAPHCRFRGTNKKQRLRAVFYSCPLRGIRTPDRLVKSELLYQLSYERVTKNVAFIGTIAIKRTRSRAEALDRAERAVPIRRWPRRRRSCRNDSRGSAIAARARPRS
jgi:hypothetical protein